MYAHNFPKYYSVYFRSINNPSYLLKTGFKLLLVRGALLQLSVKLVYALLQLLPVSADLGQTGLDASCLP